MNNPNRNIGHFPASFFNRTSRVVLNESGYHYKIREGTPIGPFQSEVQALCDLNRFINTMMNKDTGENINLKTITDNLYQLAS